jgi:2-hydroxycyclohexanecarboxyl-CoA dehydrogenase
VREFFAAVRESSDGVDVLVNNAGVSPSDSPFTDRDTESIDRTLQVNLVGAMYCTQEVLDGMATRGYGRVVNVASTAGVHGSPSDPVYGASKGGLVAFTKSLAKQYTEDGIRSNAVAPTVTDTPMLSADSREAAADLFPEGRIVQPEEVASAVRYLVSEAYDSGKVIEVAGGRYL